ncbi:hypothetical protein ACFSGI_07085 [Paenibacillus nicotianae]|uniref:Uncharacterized protein n=1 Tax=Paenibacillus nicotianae TaxID=1526551 RepID=A0ABW4UWM1_9BACL
MSTHPELEKHIATLTDEEKNDFIKHIYLILNNRSNSDLIIRAKIRELVDRYIDIKK